MSKLQVIKDVIENMERSIAIYKETNGTYPKHTVLCLAGLDQEYMKAQEDEWDRVTTKAREAIARKKALDAFDVAVEKQNGKLGPDDC